MSDPTTSCGRPGCNVTWSRDPVLEVACPGCKANVGTPCKRPSGHKAWGNFHAARDILADRLGKYGVCPLGICGLDQKPRARQLDLFGGKAA